MLVATYWETDLQSSKEFGRLIAIFARRILVAFMAVACSGQSKTTGCFSLEKPEFLLPPDILEQAHFCHGLLAKIYKCLRAENCYDPSASDQLPIQGLLLSSLGGPKTVGRGVATLIDSPTISRIFSFLPGTSFSAARRVVPQVDEVTVVRFLRAAIFR